MDEEAFWQHNFIELKNSIDIAGRSRGITWLTIFTTSQLSLGQGNVFTLVCHSVHGDLCMMPLPVWLSGPMFLLVRPLSLAIFLPGGMEGLCPGGVPTETSPGQIISPLPTESEKQAVRILLESFLVKGTFVRRNASNRDVVAAHTCNPFLTISLPSWMVWNSWRQW